MKIKTVLSVFCFRWFVSIFVLKSENKRDKGKVLTNKANYLGMTRAVIHVLDHQQLYENRIDIFRITNFIGFILQGGKNKNFISARLQFTEL